MGKVVVIGSANIDLVYHVDRLPVIGETIFGDSFVKLPGGKGLNQAVASSRCNVDTLFLGSFGSDDNFLKTCLSKDNIDLSHLLESSNEGGTAIITICNGDNTIVVLSGANNDVDVSYIEDKLSLIEKDDIVVIQNEIPQEVNEFIINYCYDNGIKIVYNPAPAREIDISLIDKVTYFTPNETEAMTIFEDEYEAIVRKYPNKVIVTVGKDGVIYFDGKDIVSIKPDVVKPVDTTGAGDTLSGIFSASLASNLSLKEALTNGVKGATLSTLKLGAQGGMPRRKGGLDEKEWDFE